MNSTSLTVNIAVLFRFHSFLPCAFSHRFTQSCPRNPWDHHWVYSSYPLDLSYCNRLRVTFPSIEVLWPRAADKMESASAMGLVTVTVLVMFKYLIVVGADFENSWTMYMEQPCCSGSGNHHVRHHRGAFTYRHSLLMTTCTLHLFFPIVWSGPMEYCCSWDYWNWYLFFKGLNLNKMSLLVQNRKLGRLRLNFKFTWMTHAKNEWYHRS